VRPVANAAQLSTIAKGLYTSGPMLLRTLQHWRPYICPFELLVQHVPEGAKVLDIGCGAGLLLSLIAGLGTDFDGVGFDVSPRAIELARQMASGASANALPAKLSFERLDVASDWPAGMFDVVFLVDVLHHVPPANQEAVVRQATSKVKPGGLFVFKDMCSKPMWRAHANRLHDLILARELIHYVPVSTVEQWAVQNGMQILQREDCNRFWYGHELRVMQRPPAPAVV
jgi:2-polyprenyl-3-methyl-5-hydroxy-6-metoxy-1,4-benzoquinol methylase